MDDMTLQDRLHEIEMIGWPEHDTTPDADWLRRSHGSAEIKRIEKPCCPEPGSVPTAETLPLTEAKPFVLRAGVHGSHKHRPTVLGPSHCSEKHLTGRAYADTLINRQTRMTGRANKEGWKTPAPTQKTEAKKAKAAKWQAKHMGR
jgi:hypothetical protein